MKLEIEIDALEAEDIMYGAALAAAFFTVAYFGFNTILSLSPVTKTFLLVSAAGIFLVAALYTREKLLETGFYINAVFAYAVGVFYSAGKLGFSPVVMVSLGLTSVALLLFLGHTLSNPRFSPGNRQLRLAGTVLVFMFLLAGAADVMGPQTRQSLSLETAINITGEETVTVGSLVVQNEFVLPRELDIAEYSACFVSPNETEAVPVTIMNANILQGGEIKRIDIEVDVPDTVSERTLNASENWTVINNENCDIEALNRTIVVTPGDISSGSFQD